MELKKITAIIRAGKLQEVENKLKDGGVEGISVSTVKGYGEYKNFFNHDWMVDHVRIEIFTTQTKVDRIVNTILDAASESLPGDGMIAVLPVERFVRIRDKSENAI